MSGAAATVEVRARDRCVLCGSECDNSASDTSPLLINGWFELKVNLHRKPSIHGKVLDELIVTRCYFLGHNGNIDAVMFSTLTWRIPFFNFFDSKFSRSIAGNCSSL